jgi:hypothetical protein
LGDLILGAERQLLEALEAVDLQQREVVARRGRPDGGPPKPAWAPRLDLPADTDHVEVGEHEPLGSVDHHAASQ